MSNNTGDSVTVLDYLEERIDYWNSNPYASDEVCEAIIKELEHVAADARKRLGIAEPYSDNQQVALDYLVEDLEPVTGVEWSLEWATDGSSCILRNAESYEKWAHPAVIEREVRAMLEEENV